MALVNLTWNNADILGNTNVTALRLSKRLRSVGGAFDVTGFTPANDLPKSATEADATIDVNKVYQFKVESLCSVGGPVANTNGLQEGMMFDCLPVSMSSTVDSITVEMNINGTDISKTKFTLIRQSNNSIIQAVEVTAPNNSYTFVGLSSNTGYYIIIELFAVVNGVLVVSSSNAYMGGGSVCGGNTPGYQISTQQVVEPETPHQNATISLDIVDVDPNVIVRATMVNGISVEDDITIEGEVIASHPTDGVMSHIFSVTILNGTLQGDSAYVFGTEEGYSGANIQNYGFAPYSPSSSKATNQNVIFDFSIQLV